MRSIFPLTSAASFPSPPPCGFDFGDVDLVHFHHGGEGALGFGAAGRHRVQQHARRDLPEDSPAVFASTERATLGHRSQIISNRNKDSVVFVSECATKVARPLATAAECMGT